METLLGCLVIPRPIAWVATRSSGGVDNLAPYSYFTISALDPPVIQFTSIGRRNSQPMLKDSVSNVLDTREFVVCLVDEDLAEKANMTATEYPSTFSEFDVTGLTREPSLMVRPSRVKESRAAIECRLFDSKRIGQDIVVFGEVLCVVVDEKVMRDGYPDPELLNPVGRLGRGHWTTLGGVVARRVPLFRREREGESPG